MEAKTERGAALLKAVGVPRVWVSAHVITMANGFMVVEHPFGFQNDYGRVLCWNEAYVFATQKEVGAFIVKALTKGV
jgi:hypothetical protein